MDRVNTNRKGGGGGHVSIAQDMTYVYIYKQTSTLTFQSPLQITLATRRWGAKIILGALLALKSIETQPTQNPVSAPDGTAAHTFPELLYAS